MHTNKVKLFSLATAVAAGTAFTSCKKDNQSDDKSVTQTVETPKQHEASVAEKNTALFEASRSKIKFSLAFVENYYPFIYWDGKKWTTGHGLTVLYNADGSIYCYVTKNTKIPTLNESDVFKGRYLTFQVLETVKSCFTVPVDENTLLASCVLSYCIGSDGFKNSEFLKAVNAGKKGAELAKTLTGYRKQLGVLNRCYFFAALLEGKITFDDLLDLRAEGCYELKIPEIVKCRKDKNGNVIMVTRIVDGKKEIVPDIIKDSDGFAYWIFDDMDKKLQEAKKHRTVSLNIGDKKYVKVKCELVKDIVADYVWQEVSSASKKSVDSNTVSMISQSEGRKIHDSAKKLANQGNIDEAIKCLEKLTETTYNCASLENDISYLKYKSKDYKGAAKAAKKALSMSKNSRDSAAAFYNIGIAYAELGKLPKANDCLTKSLRLQKSEEGKKTVSKALEDTKAKQKKHRKALVITSFTIAGTLVATHKKWMPYIARCK